MALIIKIPGECVMIEIPAKHVDQAEDYMRSVSHHHCEAGHVVDMDSIKLLKLEDSDVTIGMISQYKPESKDSFDAIWTENFRIADDAKTIIEASFDPNTKLSEHFTLGQMTHSETALRKHIDNSAPVSALPGLTRLCVCILEPVRAHYEQPFSPYSAWRTVLLNQVIGGSKNSLHCKARAVDIEVPGVSNYDLAVWISENLAFDQLILECYTEGQPTSGWVHVELKKDDVANRHLLLTYRDGIYVTGLHE